MLVLVALCVASGVEPLWASYNFTELYEIEKKSGKKAADAYRKRWDAFNERAEILAEDVRKLADQIAAFNKPLFEAKLTTQERKYYEMGDDNIGSISPILWNRVYAKDKTCVLGIAGKDKKFKATYFVTADPKLVFLGKVHVGMTTEELERFFNDSMSNMAYEGKTATWVSAPSIDGTDGHFPTVDLFYKNGIVTEIAAYYLAGNDDAYLCTSEKAEKFMENKLKQMGLN